MTCCLEAESVCPFLWHLEVLPQILTCFLTHLQRRDGPVYTWAPMTAAVYRIRNLPWPWLPHAEPRKLGGKKNKKNPQEPRPTILFSLLMWKDTRKLNPQTSTWNLENGKGPQVDWLLKRSIKGANTNNRFGSEQNWLGRWLSRLRACTVP